MGVLVVCDRRVRCKGINLFRKKLGPIDFGFAQSMGARNRGGGDRVVVPARQAT
jgi:hypothetical protein